MFKNKMGYMKDKRDEKLQRRKSKDERGGKERN
jgi:hypothetical protein